MLLVEPGEPLLHEAERLPSYAVDARASDSFVSEQPGLLEHLKVPRCGRPRVRETVCEVTCGTLTPAHMDGEEDLPARRMRERCDHCIQRREAFLGVGLLQSVVATRSSLASVMRSITASIGSHTAITAGVWCAIPDASSSRH